MWAVATHAIKHEAQYTRCRVSPMPIRRRSLPSRCVRCVMCGWPASDCGVFCPYLRFVAFWWLQWYGCSTFTWREFPLPVLVVGVACDPSNSGRGGWGKHW